ncbi:MAG: hypothetical protein S4CHLAM102_06270 [Chlamydiia bacterium]|nr:hypothetical protein [Chlamydiia bacterium]
MQRILAVALMTIVPIFIISHFKVLRAKKTVALINSEEFLQESTYSKYKSFVFIIPMNSDTATIEQHFNSVFNQNYPDYRVVILDSNEAPHAKKELDRLSAMHNKSHLITFYELEPGEDLVNSFCTAVRGCRDQDIIIYMDNSDWLAHENVLDVLNSIYANEDVWLTYSQYMEYPSYRKGHAKPMKSKWLAAGDLTRTPWIGSPIKTFYAGLLKQVDFQNSHIFGYQLSFDEALNAHFQPMVSLSKKHIRYIDDILLIHNKSTVREK